MKKAIITAAITGSIHTPSMSSHLPITPEQIVEDSIRAWEAGAAVVHIHARDPETGRPSSDSKLFGEIAAQIKSRSDLVICITTGGGLGQTTEERVAAVRAYSPELASLNAGSLNFALFHALDSYKEFKYDWEYEYLNMTEDFIFPNTFKTLREFNHYLNEESTKPEFEIYDTGMINNLAFLIGKGHVKKPVYLQFVMGILGGIPATIIPHFIESFAVAAKANVHARVLYGRDDLHKAEALFKALGRALREAVEYDERRAAVPSTLSFASRSIKIL